MIHLFRDCPKAEAIWNAVGRPATMQRTYTLDWEAWIAANIFQTKCSFLDFKWSHLFIFTCWFIWKWRNKYIFDNNFKGPNNAPLIITHYMYEWNSAVKKVEHPAASNISMLKWEKPGTSVFKLNVDGTRTANGQIGAGGVIRDWNGIWIHGFMLNIGIGEVLQAEAWGLFSGLQLAKDLGINHIMVESDSAVLMALLHSTDADLHPLGTIIQNCKYMSSCFASCAISHIHRERNMSADCLAKRSIEIDPGLCRLPDMPEFVVPDILDDMAGRTRPRAIALAAAVA